MFNLRRTPFSSMTSRQLSAIPPFLVHGHTRGRHTMRNGLDLGGRTDGLVRSQTTLGIDQVRSEDGVDQSRLSETSLACIQQGMHGSVTIQEGGKIPLYVYVPTHITLN